MSNYVHPNILKDETKAFPINNDNGQGRSYANYFKQARGSKLVASYKNGIFDVAEIIENEAHFDRVIEFVKSGVSEYLNFYGVF